MSQKSVEEWNPVNFYKEVSEEFQDELKKFKEVLSIKDIPTLILSVNALAHEVVQEVEEVARRYNGVRGQQKQEAAVHLITEIIWPYAKLLPESLGVSESQIKAITELAVNAAVGIINKLQGHEWVKDKLGLIGSILRAIGRIFH